jgi:hypothetical protein
VVHLVATLTELALPGEIIDIGGALAPLKADIVAVPAA